MQPPIGLPLWVPLFLDLHLPAPYAPTMPSAPYGLQASWNCTAASGGSHSQITEPPGMPGGACRSWFLTTGVRTVPGAISRRCQT